MKTVEEISALAKRPGKVIYRDGDRVYKTFDASYSASAVLNESLNQARIAETGLRIPKIKEVTVQEGGCAIVMEYIGGTTLEQLMETCPEREEAQTLRILCVLGNFYESILPCSEISL